MAERGWIKLHRQLQECPIWYGDRFSKGQAWVDLLLLANHRDKKILFNGEIQTIGRGQYLTSTVKLAEKWGWNRKTVSSYLKLLEQDKMITKISDNTKTLITIENYEVFQGIDEEVDNSLDNLLPNPTDNPLDTNKNIKNDKNNIIYNNRAKKSTIFTPPTVEEVQAYCKERKNNVDAQVFVDFYTANGWVQGKGKPIKDWKAAVRTWERNRKDSGGTSGGSSKNSYMKHDYDFEALEKELGI